MSCAVVLPGRTVIRTEIQRFPGRSELLCVAAVTRSFGALTVLDRVGFELAAGECVAVTGPNG